MSTTLAGQVLQLKMDTIEEDNHEDKRLPDTFDNLIGTVYGNPTLIPDSTFGGCLSFDGKKDYIVIPKIQGKKLQAISLWINLPTTQESPGWHYLLDMRSTIDESWISDKGIGNLWQNMYVNGEKVSVSWANIPKEEWVHVYLEAKNTFEGDIHLMSKYTNDELLIARICNLRLFEKTLKPETIKLQMAEDQAAMISFQKTYPIEFDLYDENDKHAIYIDDKLGGHDLIFEITNMNTYRDIKIPKGSGKVSADNYHIALTFRPGALGSNSISVDNKDWQISGPIAQNDGISIIYLLSTLEQTLSPGENIKLTLQHIAASSDALSGPTQVEVMYKKLKYADDKEISDNYRLLNLNIVSHQGKKEIPLHIGFVGSNQVMVGEENTLTLRITNILKLDPIYSQRSNIVLNTDSKFIISFDVDDDGKKEWALINKGSRKNVKVEGKGDEDMQSEIPKFTISFKEETTIEPGGHIEVNITGITPSTPEGHANIYVNYEGIPGYWEGQFACVVEKGTMISKDNKIGIGTANPVEMIHVQKKNATGYNALRLENTDSSDIELRAYGKESGLNKAGILATFNEDVDLGLVADNREKVNSTDHVIWMNGKTGNVGIGTRSPQTKLNIVGRGNVLKIHNNQDAKSEDHSEINLKTEYNQAWIEFSLNSNKRHGGIIGLDHFTDALGMRTIDHTPICLSTGVSDFYINKNRSDGMLFSDESENGTPFTLSNNSAGGKSWNIISGGKNNNAGKLMFKRDDISTPALTIDESNNVHLKNLIINDYTGGAIYYSLDETLRRLINFGQDLNRPIYTKLDIGTIVGNTGIAQAQWKITTDLSDERLKKEIKPLESVMDKVRKLIPVNFKWNDKGLKKHTDDKVNSIVAGPEATEEENEKLRAPRREVLEKELSGNQIGLVAQEIEKIFPELVEEGEDGYKKVNYKLLSVVLLGAVKELEERVRRLEGR